MKLLPASDGPEEKVITVKRSFDKAVAPTEHSEFFQCTLRLWDGKDYKRKTPMNFCH